MKVRVVTQPSGLLNGVPWPAAGDTVDLPDVVADAMVKAGNVERVAKAPAERRPAVDRDADKPVEKRPASKRGTETRKS